MSNLTCKALAAAAVSLLEERPLDKITVRDITGQGNGCRFLSECVCRSHLSVDQGWHEGYADGHGGII